MPVPHCLQRLLMRAGLYPQTLVSGAARFQEVLEGAPPLQAAAAECGLWQWGQVAVVGSGGGGGLQVGWGQGLPGAVREAMRQDTAPEA